MTRQMLETYPHTELDTPSQLSSARKRGLKDTVNCLGS